MRALAVRQPFAWGILNGKPVENREWAADYGPRIWLEEQLRRRGQVRVLLHASKGCGKREYKEAVEFIEDFCGLKVPPLAELPRGAIVGAMTITAWVEQHESPWFVGPGALTLADVVALPKPIPCTGAQGFFRIPVDVAEAVKEQVRAWKEGG